MNLHHGYSTKSLFKVSFILLIMILQTSTLIGRKTIYMSSSGNDANDGSIEFPIKTFTRAKEICKSSLDISFAILLKGGDTFTEFYPDTVSLYGSDQTTFAFVWDIDRALTISTYGSDEKAHLVGAGYYVHSGGPSQAILVIEPSTQNVLIENLFFEMWELGTIMTFRTEDVIIRNIKIDKIGPYYFPEEQIPDVYVAGVIYPKNSTRILIEDVVMTNCHNNYDQVGALHGFYCTRLNQSEIRNCYLANISGSPFKFRRSPANNVYVHDNECYYTGVSTQTPNQVQFGFLRYSGDPGGNCPYALTFENNIFHYPWVWLEHGENPETAYAVKCSISNETSCGSDACDDSTKVKWINNDFKYKWELTDKWNGGDVVIINSPSDLSAVAVSDRQIDLSWTDNSDNEEGFKIQRKREETSYWTVGTVGPDITSHSDQFILNPSTQYTYRVIAYHETITSGATNEVTETTLDEIVSVNSDEEYGVPKKYDLAQNYPNPFNPKTTIDYQLPKDSYVKIRVFNIHGQLIQTLVDRVQNAGYYEVIWEPDQIVSGIYFYQIESDNFRKIKKMTFLK